MQDSAAINNATFLAASKCADVGYVTTIRKAGYTTILTLPLAINKVETVALGKQVLAFTVSNVYADTEVLVLAASDYNNMKSVSIIFELGAGDVAFKTMIADIPGDHPTTKYVIHAIVRCSTLNYTTIPKSNAQLHSRFSCPQFLCLLAYFYLMHGVAPPLPFSLSFFLGGSWLW